jgi:hypothetical protein
VNKSFAEIKSAMKVHGLAKKPEQDAWKLFNKKFNPKFKRSFPFLSGNKIFPLWIRMLHDNVGIDLKNLDKIPIPVDIHIARASFTTGCLRG